VVIKVICFDADGVVVYPQKQFSRHLKEEHSISPDMTRGFFCGVFNDCLVGAADLRDVLPTYLKEWGWTGSTEEFIATWLKFDHVVDSRVINTIQRLRQNKVICCLVTSQERNRAEYMKTKMGFQTAFDRLFFSCEIGLQKPNHAYYQYIQKALDVENESILFWDDLEINVIAARENGWNAEIYTEFDEFEKTMHKYDLIAESAKAHAG
jgi:putative hydrolase of the HAD superfamily